MSLRLLPFVRRIGVQSRNRSQGRVHRGKKETVRLGGAEARPALARLVVSTGVGQRLDGEGFALLSELGAGKATRMIGEQGQRPVGVLRRERRSRTIEELRSEERRVGKE